MEETLYYPVGQQNFRELREDGCIYVDKTRYIAKIVDSKMRYWFLARPRRFGKSLFLSSLEYFYKGERKLFKGLFIDRIEWDWKEYPVLRLDLNVEKYTLGVPNIEVGESLFKELLPFYVKVRRGGDAETVVRNIINSLLNGQPDKFVRNLDIFFAGIPYEMKMDDENNLHNAIYILLTLIGTKAEAEVHTSYGRIDLLLKTTRYVYIIELKFDKSAEEAMSQIKEKEYALPYANDRRRIFLIGLNFSSETRHLDEPVVEEMI